MRTSSICRASVRRDEQRPYGAGVGLAFVTASIAALAGVAERESGLASGLSNTAFQVGAALGVAIVTTVAVSRSEDYLATNEGANPLVVLAEGFQSAFAVCVVLAGIGVALAILLLGRPRIAPQERLEPVPETAARHEERRTSADRGEASQAASSRPVRKFGRVRVPPASGSTVSSGVMGGGYRSGVAEEESKVADRDAIVRVALDYFEGWFDGDAARMERALHPDLAKRSPDDAPAPGELEKLTAPEMIEATAKGIGKTRDVPDRGLEVEVEHVHREIANVTVRSAVYVEYLQLVRTREGWKIVNALWQHP